MIKSWQSFVHLEQRHMHLKMTVIKKWKKQKEQKKCVIKNELKIDDYKTSVLEGEKIIRSELRFRSDHHNVFTEEVNKVAISSNHDKRIKE